MTWFRLEIKTDNAAFDENPADEVARILADLFDRLMEGCPNGNTVGWSEWVHDTPGRT